MSSSNEVLADDFQHSMSDRIHSAMDSVGEFRAEHVSNLEHLRESCSAMILAKQEVRD